MVQKHRLKLSVQMEMPMGCMLRVVGLIRLTLRPKFRPSAQVEMPMGFMPTAWCVTNGIRLEKTRLFLYPLKVAWQ